MPELLASRFLQSGSGWIDLASGEPVRLQVSADAPRSGVFAWNDWCAVVAAMRHPVMQELVDYGAVGTGRSFEAFGVRPPLAVRGASSSGVLEHAAAFLESRGVHLDARRAAAMMRPVVAGPGAARHRTVGIVLQPRTVLRQIEDALADVAPGGVAELTVSGPPGSGLRTLRTQVARLARLQGYVPLGIRVLAEAGWLASTIGDRHVCLLLGPGATPAELRVAARLSGTLGLTSARRHVLVRFTRSDAASRNVLLIDRMGVAAMVCMIFARRDRVFDAAGLEAAARRAGGLPGLYLAALRAARPAEPVMLASIAHESVVPYTVGEPVAHRARPVTRSLSSAASRAARLTARGRHAAAIRLLSRASRVLELRGDRERAAECAEALGWILRDRGRTAAALEQFSRARSLAHGCDVRAAIATGVVWTDEGRLIEAEAALRSAAAAASLVGDAAGARRAALALARCLYWAGRPDEALAALPPDHDRTPDAEALSLRARILVAQRSLRGAAACAGAAREHAACGSDRDRVRAARALAEVSAAMGDRHSARAAAFEGLRLASAAHLPLMSLRLRALIAGASPDGHGRTARGSIGAAHVHARVPPVVRRALERALQSGIDGSAPTPATADEPGLIVLQELLELASAADDDDQAVSVVLDAVLNRLRAATIELVAGDGARRVLGRSGRPWTGERRAIERALAGGAVQVTGTPAEACQAVRHAGRPIAAIACRWTATTSVGPDAGSVLRAGALALAPAARALIDRVPVPQGQGPCRELIGESAPAILLRDAVARAARAPFSVLIEGESGSGKELVARAIHRLSPRRDRRLCAVNCAALSEELLEAELFGHVRGAFTGAVGERPGLFEEADGGTIFLDEVGELSPRAQAKLLRVLQDGEVRRVGENFARRVDARVIAATNRRLETEVQEGRFRADLLFRLDVVRILVPPLRERADDIPLLAAQFWDDAARRVQSRAVLGSDTMIALTRYDWPGNVRQLQNVIASLAVHAPRRGRVAPSLLPAHIARTAREPAQTFETARQEFERRFVAAELARAGGHRAKAAKALGVTRQGLAKMLRRLGLEDTRPGARQEA